MYLCTLRCTLNDSNSLCTGDYYVAMYIVDSNHGLAARRPVDVAVLLRQSSLRYVHAKDGSLRKIVFSLRMN